MRTCPALLPLSSFSPLGQDIDGEAAGDWFGWSVSLSADGNVVAAGGFRNDGNGPNTGHVRIYQYFSIVDQWVQLGQDLNGESGDDEFGNSVSLSSDGSIVAAGAPLHDGSGSDAGHVCIYKYNIDIDEWSQLGQVLDGEAGGKRFGVSVSLSADGTVVAAGADWNNGCGSNAGHIRVFESSF